MKIKLEEAIQLLQNEIVWCLDNPDPTLNKDQQMGFMNGIRQAQHILEAAEHSVYPTLLYSTQNFVPGCSCIDCRKRNPALRKAGNANRCIAFSLTKESYENKVFLRMV